MTLPFDHTHDTDLGVWNGFIWGMGQSFDMERTGRELSIHDHDID